MYWSAHVGTQENGCHDVMKNATQSPNNISHDPIATAIGNNIVCKSLLIERQCQAHNMKRVRCTYSYVYVVLLTRCYSGVTRIERVCALYEFYTCFFLILKTS